MTPFAYARAGDAGEALRLAAAPGARFLGAGTNLVDLMRETIERPALLVDVTGLDAGIRVDADGDLIIGGAARNTDVAAHAEVRRRYPALARAILAGASGQIRNMATVAGNLLQRTRCTYFYDVEGARCNKRRPGQGCDALHGFNRIHAILGASPHCVATHPSDMAVALAAFDAEVHVVGPDGQRVLPVTELHRLPGDQPDLDTVLAPGELITHVRLPACLEAARSTYVKVRDRASYAFALVSVAAAVAVTDGRVTAARLALGGVAHKPWRAHEAEAALLGQPASAENFTTAAAAAMQDARPLRHNGFKIELARRVIAATFAELAGEPA